MAKLYFYLIIFNLCSLYASQKTQNCFEILGVTPTASPEEIKKTYYQKAKKCHPDKNSDNDKAAEEFKTLSAAYKFCLEPELKQVEK